MPEQINGIIHINSADEQCSGGEECDLIIRYLRWHAHLSRSQYTYEPT